MTLVTIPLPESLKALIGYGNVSEYFRSLRLEAPKGPEFWKDLKSEAGVIVREAQSAEPAVKDACCSLPAPEI